MKLETIVYATDFSEANAAALPMAAAVARDSGARLLITHVVQPPMADARLTYAVVAEQARDEQQRLLEQVVPPDPQIRYEHRILDGAPSDAIVDLAEREKADLIVMGTHGRSGLKRLLMGSVAEAVVRRAPCPVMTIKQPGEAEAESGDSEQQKSEQP